jgi:hypothetical protein
MLANRTRISIAKSVPGVPSGRRACGKIGCGRSPTPLFLGAGEAVSQFDAGGRFEGLRIVATSTRVRLSRSPLVPAGGHTLSRLANGDL